MRKLKHLHPSQSIRRITYQLFASIGQLSCPEGSVASAVCIGLCDDVTGGSGVCPATGDATLPPSTRCTVYSGPGHVVPYLAFCSLPTTVETEDLKPHIDLFSGCVRGWSPQQVEGPEGGEQVRGGGDGDSAQISTGENPANPQ